MTQAAKQNTQPDRIARKLFFLTVLGAFTFAMIVIATMRLSNAQLSTEGAPTTPLVHLVQAH